MIVFRQHFWWFEFFIEHTCRCEVTKWTQIVRFPSHQCSYFCVRLTFCSAFTIRELQFYFCHYRYSIIWNYTAFNTISITDIYIVCSTALRLNIIVCQLDVLYILCVVELLLVYFMSLISLQSAHIYLYHCLILFRRWRLCLCICNCNSLAKSVCLSVCVSRYKSFLFTV